MQIGRFDPCFRKIPWRRAWQPTPVFLPGESYGQRSLAGNSPQGHKGAPLKRLSTSVYLYTYIRSYTHQLFFSLTFPQSPQVTHVNYLVCITWCAFLFVQITIYEHINVYKNKDLELITVLTGVILSTLFCIIFPFSKTS